METIPARWIDLGLAAPEVFHASYAALAEAAAGQPALVWGRCGAHVCLGQSQSPQLELDFPLAVPVVRRPLGGGTAWIDENQYCYAVVAPPHCAPSKPGDWFAWMLQPMAATYREFGLPAALRGRDLWCGGKKIAGSGAATINGHAVLAASFLLRFPAERFAACVACPSPEFRDWLRDGLREAMTDWISHAEPPSEAGLMHSFARQAGLAFGWQFESSALSDIEVALRDAVINENEEWAVGGRLVPHGIKLNAATYLTERRRNGNWARVLTVEGRIARIALSLELPEASLRRLLGCVPNTSALQAVLSELLPKQDAAAWAELIGDTAHTG